MVKKIGKLRQGKYIHYIVVSPHLLQIKEISKANTQTKNANPEQY